MDKVKRIAVLTSGGDAPGMNAAIRAVTRSAIALGISVYGVKSGYNGLIKGEFVKLDSLSVSNILQKGGTILCTARCPEFRTEQGIKKAVANCKKFQIDGIVIIGGDGSFRGARELSLAGIPCVGIPGTIDNDISSTDYTIGFDTALNTAVEAIDKLRDTTASHNRCSLVEVMGNGAGHLAVYAAVSCGAVACAIKEMNVSGNAKEYIINKIEESEDTGNRNFIVIVGEGVANIYKLAEQIEAETNIETRATVLGYIQRGGSPSSHDRVIATKMGAYAVELLSRGIGNRVVAEKHKEIVDFDILQALEMKKTFDKKAFDINNTISL